MPFQSEKQRRYLWANEPEIARDWTDTYGSGIAKALGGRIGFFTGAFGGAGAGRGRDSGGASHDRGGQQHQATATRQVAATRARDRHPTTESTGREQAIADITYNRPDQLRVERPSQHIGAGDTFQDYNENLRNLQRQQEYQQGAYQRAHPFLSKVRSGLGSLGRGIGQVARNFNPLSFAFENPLMKLLASRYGRTNIRDLFQRNNQNINWNDPDEKEDVAWENINYNPNALTRLEQLGIMSPNINKYEWDKGPDTMAPDYLSLSKFSDKQKKKAEKELGWGVEPKNIMPKLQQDDPTSWGFKTEDAIKAQEFIGWLETEKGMQLTEDQKREIFESAGQEMEDPI